MSADPQQPLSSAEPEIIVSESERWIYSVMSRTNPKTRYRVDLLGCGGASQCACLDWSFVASGNIANGLEWGSYYKRKDRTTCYHTWKVRTRYMNELTRRLANKEDFPPARPSRVEQHQPF